MTKLLWDTNGEGKKISRRNRNRHTDIDLISNLFKRDICINVRLLIFFSFAFLRCHLPSLDWIKLSSPSSIWISLYLLTVEYVENEIIIHISNWITIAAKIWILYRNENIPCLHESLSWVFVFATREREREIDSEWELLCTNNHVRLALEAKEGEQAPWIH